eukprot:2461088-Pleurochrysis_carterae.AAC.1
MRRRGTEKEERGEKTEKREGRKKERKGGSAMKRGERRGRSGQDEARAERTGSQLADREKIGRKDGRMLRWKRRRTMNRRMDGEFDSKADR